MPNEDEVIGRFLEAVERLSSREVASATGVSAARIVQWRKGERGPMLPATRRKVESYLSRDAQSNEAEPPPAEGERLGLGARLAAAEQQSAGDVVRLALAYDALAATIRGEAVLVEARAAEARAMALREAESASRFRNMASVAAPSVTELSAEDARHLAALGAEMVRRARQVEEAARRDQEPPQQRRAGGAG